MPKTPRIEWSEPARTDLLAIVEYLIDTDVKAAQDLKDEIQAKVDLLPTHPKKYAKSERAPGYRQLTVRANYLVLYRLLSEKSPEIIDVAAVVHARRQWPLVVTKGSEK